MLHEHLQIAISAKYHLICLCDHSLSYQPHIYTISPTIHLCATKNSFVLSLFSYANANANAFGLLTIHIFTCDTRFNGCSLASLLNCASQSSAHSNLVTHSMWLSIDMTLGRFHHTTMSYDSNYYKRERKKYIQRRRYSKHYCSDVYSDSTLLLLLFIWVGLRYSILIILY